MMRAVLGSFIISTLLLSACGGSDTENTGGTGGTGGTGTGGTPVASTGSTMTASGSSGSGGSTFTLTGLSAKRYVAAGDRAYVIGAEDGAFPPMGWHIRGEMGGVWAHPIKLLDGYWFALDGAWLPVAAEYTTG